MLAEYGIYILLGFAAIALLLSHHALGNGVYIMTKHWRESLFLLLCATAGAGFAVSKDTLIPQAGSFYISMTDPATAHLDSTITTCKDFVAAKASGSNFTPPAPHGLIQQISPPDYWEVCARTFGMNYWKYDIAVNGQNGGKMLCDAYAHESNPSGRVRAWCDTVFSSDQL